MCEFLRIIETVFNNWTSLKLAIDHGMGGEPATVTQKLRCMVDNVHTVLCKGDFYDLVDMLEDSLDSDFDTELQDNSATDVATVLFELHRGWHEGRKDEVVEQISQLKCPTSIFDVNIANRPPVRPEELSNPDVPGPSTSRRRRDPPPPPSEEAGFYQPMNRRPTNPDADSWTVVSRRK